jgi:hypothetical protein
MGRSGFTSGTIPCVPGWFPNRQTGPIKAKFPTSDYTDCSAGVPTRVGCSGGGAPPPRAKSAGAPRKRNYSPGHCEYERQRKKNAGGDTRATTQDRNAGSDTHFQATACNSNHTPARMFTQTCTCGAPRKYHTIVGLSNSHTSHTPSFPRSRFL